MLIRPRWTFVHFALRGIVRPWLSRGGVELIRRGVVGRGGRSIALTKCPSSGGDGQGVEVPLVSTRGGVFKDLKDGGILRGSSHVSRLTLGGDAWISKSRSLDGKVSLLPCPS